MGYQDLGVAGINGRFFSRLEQATLGTFADKIGMLIDSNMEVETYRWLGAVPAMRKWLGGRHEKRLRDDVFTIRNEPYEGTMDIDIDDLRRDKTGQILIRLGELAQRTAQLWDKLITDLLIVGTSTVCYDGQFFFDTDHASGASGSLDNDLASTFTAPTAPTALEMVTAIMKSIQQMWTYKDDQGEPINAGTKRFLIMVPAHYAMATMSALSAQFIGAAITNALLSSSQANLIGIEMAVNQRLTANAFYTFGVDSDVKPIILQDEVPVDTEVVGPGSEEAFKNRRYLYGVSAVRSVGYGLWQRAVLTTVS